MGEEVSNELDELMDATASGANCEISARDKRAIWQPPINRVRRLEIPDTAPQLLLDGTARPPAEYAGTLEGLRTGATLG